MIFVTIGTQAPFDRLIRAVDEWSEGKDVEIVAQVSSMSEYRAENLRTVETLSRQEYDEFLNKCDLIISHAGMGTIIKALEMGIPIITLPRLFDHGEHRNNHQVHTAKALAKMGMIYECLDENMLKELLDKISEVRVLASIDRVLSNPLTEEIKNLILEN